MEARDITRDSVTGEVIEITLEGSVEPHFHGRLDKEHGDGRMEMVAESVADEHEVIALIGNTGKHPLLTQADVDRYLPTFAAALPRRERKPDLFAAPLLTDATTPEMVREMRRQQPRTVLFLKAFLAGVSNDGGHSVSDVRKLAPTLHACHDNSVDAPPLAVDWHIERKRTAIGHVIEMRDREWYGIEHDFTAVLEVDPEGCHSPKHISDGRTVEFLDAMRAKGHDVYGELAPHYFIKDHESLYEAQDGGTAFNAHDLCWPLYKNLASLHKLCAAALSGKPWYHFGSDCAWHVDDPTRPGGVKITNDGVVCGGTAILPALSKSIAIDLFVQSGKATLLDQFFSQVARKKYGLPPARTKVRYARKPWQVPEAFTGEGPAGAIKVRPFMRGETVNWKIVA